METLPLFQGQNEPGASSDEPEADARPLPIPESLAVAMTGDEGLQVGAEIGTYRVLELIGEGGMGRVYLAEHTRLQRKVALKVLRQSLASDKESVRRFVQEAMAVNQIRHEHIVEVTDIVEDPSGRPCAVMELLEGESLGERLARELVLSAREAALIGAQVASAMNAAHAAGVVHRDLKPDNVFLARRADGRPHVKVLDFGVARLVKPLGGFSVAETAEGALCGTPEYMAPEQFLSSKVDGRADIYSLGVVLYELVTGRRPFTADTLGEMVVKHLTIPPVPMWAAVQRPVLVPLELEQLILKCLAKDAAARPQTMAEVEEVLRRVADSPTPLERRQKLRAPEPDDPVERRPTRALRPIALFSGAALALGGALFTIDAVLQRTTAPAAGAGLALAAAELDEGRCLAAMPLGATCWAPPAAIEEPAPQTVAVVEEDEQVAGAVIDEKRRTRKAGASPPKKRAQKKPEGRVEARFVILDPFAEGEH